MASLADLQRRFARALDGGSADVISGAAGIANVAGIAVYRNTIRTNHRSALRATYPVVCALTGTPFFHAAADGFADAHPSRSGDLNLYGDVFGDFLAGYPPAHALAYLPDVARLEWAIDEAQRAADEAESRHALLAALAAAPPEALAQQRFALDASCRLLRSAYPVMRIWQVHQPGCTGAPAIDFDAPPEHLLVRREAGVAAIEPLDPGEFAWLVALEHGQPLGFALESALAVDPHFAFERTLRDRIADRTLARLRAP
jgi:hypothetical protein